MEAPAELVHETAGGHAAQRHLREFEGTTFEMAEFNYDSRRIWGATAGMLVEFRDFLHKEL